MSSKCDHSMPVGLLCRGKVPVFLQAFGRLRDRTSMRLQSAVITAMLSFMTVIAITIPTARLVYDNAIERADSEMQVLATTMAQRLDREMFERYREVQNIASIRSMGSRWRKSPTEARIVVEQLQATYPAYTWIGFAAPDGVVQASTKGMLENQSVAERPWFKAGLRGPTALDLHEAKLLAKILTLKSNDEPFRFVDVTAPVRDETGSIVGVLGAHLSWTWAGDLRSQLLSALDPELQTGLLVTSADGSVILGGEFGSVALTRDQLALTKVGPSNFTVAYGGRERIMAAVATRGVGSYPGLGWQVVAHRPKSVALAYAYRITLTILGIGILAAIGSVASAFWIASRVTRPISNLARCADRIGRSPGPSLFNRQQGSSDVRRLSNALRSLSRRVDFAECDATDARNHEMRSVRARIEDAERHQQIIASLRELADTDPLTGLLNRRGFFGQAADVLAFFQRYGGQFAILVVDIDHFKRVNDRYGHAAGDEVIKAVARGLSDAVRQTDRVARFGGEEFVVILREIDQVTLRKWADRTRRLIETSTVTVDGTDINVTISLGGAMVCSDDEDVEDIIKRADEALYQAKSTGRNRACIAGTLWGVGQAA